MFGASIGRAGQRIIDAMVRWLARGHISPNILTFIGVAINVGSGMLFGFGRFFWAGIILIVANLFDMLDGQVAHAHQRGRIGVVEVDAVAGRVLRAAHRSRTVDRHHDVRPELFQRLRRNDRRPAAASRSICRDSSYGRPTPSPSRTRAASRYPA